MRFRTGSGETARSNGRSTDGTETSAFERIVGLAIVTLGAIILVDAVFRYLDSSADDPASVVDEARERLGEPLSGEPTAIQIEDSDSADVESDAETPESDAEEGSQPIDDEQLNAEMTPEERSDEEIDERTEPDVEDEPATPGEMTIDEDVADELEEDDETDEE